MKIYCDTEFNSFGGEFISIGLVADNGSEFYAVADIPSNPHPWVAQNVIPMLKESPIGFNKVRTGLQSFLQSLHSNLEVYADWNEDHIHFLKLLAGNISGTMFSIPVVMIMARPPGPIVSIMPHNALSDARALKMAWEESLVA